MPSENELTTLMDIKKEIQDLPSERISKDLACLMADLAFNIGRREAFRQSKQIVDESLRCVSLNAAHIEGEVREKLND